MGPVERRVSDFVGAYFGELLWGCFFAMLAWRVYSQRRGERLAAKGLCARCAAPNASVPAPNKAGLLCDTCAETLRRQGRVGTAAVYAYAVLMSLGLGYGIWESVSRGQGVPWNLIGMLLPFGILGPLWLERRSRVPPASQ